MPINVIGILGIGIDIERLFFDFGYLQTKSRFFNVQIQFMRRGINTISSNVEYDAEEHEEWRDCREAVESDMVFHE